MTSTRGIAPLRVVVVGGGVSALETVLALHALGEGRFQITLIAPEPDFVLRPLTVAEPFARGHTEQLALADFMAAHSGHFVRSAVLRVDADAQRVTCATGADVVFDVLVLALGASASPAFTHALTFGSEPLALNGILTDLEQGWSTSVAFVVPRGCSWPLPIYELALMTAAQVRSMGMDHAAVHLVTPEEQPLGIFGGEAAAAIAELLAAAGVRFHAGADPRVERGGRIALGDEAGELTVDRVVALPVLEGPRLDGVPCDAHGFVPVDEHGAVIGLDRVYAVGDAADHAIKQGGLACQQADVAAAHIAACAGAPVTVPPLQQVLRGRLLTGRLDRYLRREVDGAVTHGEAAEEPLWWPPGKVSGRYLTPYLADRGVIHLRAGVDGGTGVDVDVPVDRPRAGVARARATGSGRPA